MKRVGTLSVMKCCLLAVVFTCFAVSCKFPGKGLDVEDGALVKDSVEQMAINISNDVSRNGPKAWLNYFEDSPGFFMATDGQLAFKDYPTAKNMVSTVIAKSISKITLNWKNIRIEPLTMSLASFAADFHEDLVLSSGAHLSVDGYFTSIAHFDGSRWKLRNMNWAIKKAALPAK